MAVILGLSLISISLIATYYIIKKDRMDIQEE